MHLLFALLLSYSGLWIDVRTSDVNVCVRLSKIEKVPRGILSFENCVQGQLYCKILKRTEINTLGCYSKPRSTEECSKVRKYDRHWRDWSQHTNICKSQMGLNE